MMIPFFMFFLLGDINYGVYIAAGIFLIAALTDSLDGYIARTRNQVTTLGKFIDPLADKLLVTAALVCLVEMNEISSIVAMVIIAREFSISGFRVVAASENIIISASIWGKIKTITQIVAIMYVLLFRDLNIVAFGISLKAILLGITVFVTLFSGLDYLYINRRVILKGLIKK